MATRLLSQLRTLGLRTDFLPAGSGTLLPVLHIAHGLTAPGPPHIVATASPDGTCALTAVHPQPPTDPTLETR
ncbi:hypothetical protein K9U14_22815 [Streptomyces griseocarneus]|nr:hypothetical protein [Streptomyces griseocarneus]